MNLEALKFRQSQIKNVLESSPCLPSLGNSAREGDFIILIRDSSAEAQPTDKSLASRPNCRHANDNRQQAVCFYGEF
jgi:hypothetical protein